MNDLEQSWKEARALQVCYNQMSGIVEIVSHQIVYKHVRDMHASKQNV
jgi:hypothetical protein